MRENSLRVPSAPLKKRRLRRRNRDDDDEIPTWHVPDEANMITRYNRKQNKMNPERRCHCEDPDTVVRPRAMYQSMFSSYRCINTSVEWCNACCSFSDYRIEQVRNCEYRPAFNTAYVYYHEPEIIHSDDE
jgi:hypothetical protein